MVKLYALSFLSEIQKLQTMEPDTAHPATGRFESIPPAVLLIGAIVSVQLSAALAMSLFSRLGPAVTASLRVGLAALLLLLIYRPRFDQTIRRNFLLLAALGASIGGMNLFIYLAFARIPLGVAVTLEFIGPLSLALMLSRKPADFIWAFCAGAGVLLLTPLTGAKLDHQGILYALIAGGCWAAYARLAAIAGARMSGGKALTIAIAIAAVLLLPLGIIGASSRPFTLEIILIGFAVAIASTVIPFTLEFEALRRLHPRTYGILTSLDPAMAALTGALFIHQTLNPRAITAILLVIIAAAGVTLGARKTRNDVQ